MQQDNLHFRDVALPTSCLMLVFVHRGRDYLVSNYRYNGVYVFTFNFELLVVEDLQRWKLHQKHQLVKADLARRRLQRQLSCVWYFCCDHKNLLLYDKILCPLFLHLRRNHPWLIKLMLFFDLLAMFKICVLQTF